MFAGLVGQVVQLFDPYTEAHPVAVALQFLVAFGNIVGRAPHFYVGETIHHMNENLAIVGGSSRTRKGDSKNVALRALVDTDSAWAANHASGLSSGEGLIHAVRDPYGNDLGVSDKRLLVIETEFTTALKQFSRDGNTLSNLLRDAWDGKPTLRTMTRNSPLRATEPHISVIAHSTPEDLHDHFSNLEAANGLGNRFLFALTDRSKFLANPGRVPPKQLASLVHRVSTTVQWAATTGTIVRTPAGDALWAWLYPELTKDEPGLIGKLLARSEAHVARLSALYALSARTSQIDVPHLESALAAWRYVAASTRLIFCERTGNEAADRIRHEMVPGQSLSLTAIRSQIFNNHVTAGKLRTALEVLLAMGDIQVAEAATLGRPVVMVTRLARPATDAQMPGNSADAAA